MIIAKKNIVNAERTIAKTGVKTIVTAAKFTEKELATTKDVPDQVVSPVITLKRI